MRFYSPLRYPGGKAALSGFLADTIRLNDLVACSYLEPFAGGAGAALQLLHDGVVSALHLNDADPRIHAFWVSVLNHTERFAEAITSATLTVDEWRRQRDICDRADVRDSFELGFATFYLNRCNRSGIIRGAAPIGGYAQSGKWKMEARFYRDTLAERVRAIGESRDCISITNDDALSFLKRHLTSEGDQPYLFIYLDPPYYSKSKRLYMNIYEDADHQQLADFMEKQVDNNWLMSYDDDPFIKDLYQTHAISNWSLAYSLQLKRKSQELLIRPSRLILPPLEHTD